MEIKVLASSSAGNCSVLKNATSCIMIEAGISFKSIQKGCDFNVSEFDGCLITHLH